MSASNSQAFNHRLESLRGVAAMMVALGHAFLLLDAAAWPGVLRVCNGHAAVRLFFVLSGYVLSLALNRMNGPPSSALLTYAVRRFLRIYPAFAGATFLVAGATLLLPLGQANSAASVWFNQFYLKPVDTVELRDNLLFHSASLNCVTWTLRVEILGSLFLGVMHFLTRSWGWRGRAVLLAALMGAAWRLFDGDLVPYLFMFWLGYMLPAVAPLVAKLEGGRRWMAPAMLLGAVAVFLRSQQTRFELWGEPLGASMMLAWLLYGRPLAVYRLLDRGVVRFYGRISYSFYLLHFPVLYWAALALLRGLSPETLLWQPNVWAAGVGFGSVAIATPLAWLLYVGVEKPGIALSKRLCDSLERARKRERSIRPPEAPVATPSTAVPLITGK
jgi:peptidoglycan/LPS O-acetylase OafA/YrhL